MKTLHVVTPALLSVLCLSAFGRSGPDHLSLRPLAMGNAFVAVADDQDAMYYNVAGLNQINSLGNSQQSDMPEYLRDPMNLRLDVGAFAPSPDELLNLWHLYKKHESSFLHPKHNLENDSTLESDYAPYSNKPIETGAQVGMALAVHDFGTALWTNSTVSTDVVEGFGAPVANAQNVQVDAVFQIAGAHGFLDNQLSLGIGYRLANRQQIQNYVVSASSDLLLADSAQQKQFERSLLDTLRDREHRYSDPGSYGSGLDLGALWQQNRWLRFGASLENLGMFLNGYSVTPKLTVGTDITPEILQNGGSLGRKVNFALDFEDLLNNDRNYKLLSKLDFGAEVEQEVFWWLTSVRVGGGFKGGYWTAGAGVRILAVQVDAAVPGVKKPVITPVKAKIATMP